MNTKNTKIIDTSSAFPRIKDTIVSFKKISAKKVAQALGGQEIREPRVFYVVALENQFTATGNEYFGIDPKENKLLGFHNPSSAYQFATIPDAKRFIEQFITIPNVKVIPIVDEIRKFNDWMKNGCLYRSLLARNPKISKKYNKESREEILQWHIECAKSQEFEIRQDHYESWPDLWEKFTYIHGVQSFEGGDITFELMFPKDGKLGDFKKEFTLIRPHCTCRDGTGKLYNVFDHYLCENGNSVSLVEFKDGSFLVKSRHSIEVSGTLEICFDYLKKERWYE